MARRLARLRHEREARRLAWLASWPDRVHAEGTRAIGARAAAQEADDETQTRARRVPPFDEGARARVAAMREALAAEAARDDQRWRGRRAYASLWLDTRREEATLLWRRAALRLMGPPRGGPRLTVRGWNGAYDTCGLLATPSSSEDEGDAGCAAGAGEHSQSMRGPPSRAVVALDLERPAAQRRRRRSSTRSRGRSGGDDGGAGSVHNTRQGGAHEEEGSGSESQPREFRRPSPAALGGGTGPEFVMEARARSAKKRSRRGRLAELGQGEAVDQADFDCERYYNDGPVYVGPCRELCGGRARRCGARRNEADATRVGGTRATRARADADGEEDAQPWRGHYGVWRSVDGWVIAGPNVTLGLDPAWLYGHYDLRYPGGASYSGLLCAGKPHGRGRLARADGSCTSGLVLAPPHPRAATHSSGR